MQWPEDLIILSAPGMPENHYRIRGGELCFRIIYQQSAGAWRKLTVQDVLMHLVWNTSVAEWLYARRGLADGTALKKAA